MQESGGINLHRYVGSNPTDYVDIDGLVGYEFVVGRSGGAGLGAGITGGASAGLGLFLGPNDPLSIDGYEGYIRVSPTMDNCRISI